METFINNDMNCVVLEQCEDVALIAIINREDFPFVVCLHEPNHNDWCWGDYYEKLSIAYNCFKSKTSK